MHLHENTTPKCLPHRCGSCPCNHAIELAQPDRLEMCSSAENMFFSLPVGQGLDTEAVIYAGGKRKGKKTEPRAARTFQQFWLRAHYVKFSGLRSCGEAYVFRFLFCCWNRRGVKWNMGPSRMKESTSCPFLRSFFSELTPPPTHTYTGIFGGGVGLGI